MVLAGYAHYRLVSLPVAPSATYGETVTTSEAESFDELIDDCADIPRAVCSSQTLLPLPLNAAPWTVSDRCLSQVNDIDDYV